MVLTSPSEPKSPTRGQTLPHPVLMRQSNVDLSVSTQQRARTLPITNRSMTLSYIDLNNAINNNPSRTKSPHSVSILSLHQSDDNEAYCLDNRYGSWRGTAIAELHARSAERKALRQ